MKDSKLATASHTNILTFQVSITQFFLSLSRKLTFRRCDKLTPNEPHSNLRFRIENDSDNETTYTLLMPNELSDGHLSDTELLFKPSTFVSEKSCICGSAHQCQQSQDLKYHQQPVQRRSSLPAQGKIKSTSGKQDLSSEELECDVSIEGCGPDQPVGQRNEFSFTLYDLDGHGKITKDDISGLVKTIYETIGQSIKVPHYGSKTIKVKLTVSPEKKSCKNIEENTNQAVSHKTRNIHCFSPNNDKWNSDLHFSKSKERSYRQEQKFQRRHSISSSGLSEHRETDVLNDKGETPLNNNKYASLIHNPALINTSTSIFSKYKRRSNSLQRQELLHIIQANMEKNNLCHQNSRNPPNGVLLRHRTKNQPITKQYVNSWENPLQSNKRGNILLNNDKQIHRRSHSHDLPNNHFAKREKKNKLPTPHELKHRYREFEQARAKEQVVRWLEQEFSSQVKYCNNGKNNNLNNCKTTSKEDAKSNSHSTSNEKYCHIHKHVHHHYHHYREPPIVV